jgi:hypothetical protein
MMFTLGTALQLMQLAAAAPPVVKAIYDSAKALLHETDQARLKEVYDAEYARAVADHEELQATPVQPA